MNKDIFIKIFRNKILHKLIFKYIHWIHHDIDYFRNNQSVKWIHLLDRPEILVLYNYIDLLNDYTQRNSKTCKNDRDYYLFTRRMKDALENSIIYDRFHLLGSLIEYVLEHPLMNTILSHCKLMDLASMKASKQTVNLLISHSKKYAQLSSGETAVISTISSGNLEFIQWFTELFSEPYKRNIAYFFLETVKFGSTNIIDWFLDSYKPKRKNPPTTTLSPLSKISLIIEDYSYIVNIESIWSNAFKSNNYQILDYLKSKIQLPEDVTYDLIAAIQSGSIEVVEWIIHNKTNPLRQYQILCALAGKGKVDAIEFIHRTLSNEFHFQSPNVVEWFCTNVNHYCDGAKAMDFAIENENAGVIKWLHNNRSNTAIDIGGSPYALDAIIWNQNTQLRDWLTANRTEGFSAERMTHILPHSSMNETIKWFLKNRTESFEVNVLDFIVIRHPTKIDYEVIEWIRENKPEIPFTEMSIQHAFDNSNTRLLNIIMKTIPQFSEQFISGSGQSAYRNNSLDMLKWLHENTTELQSMGRLSMGLFEQCSKMVQEFTVKNLPNRIPLEILDFYCGNIGMFKYIIYNHPQFIDMKSLITASKFGSLEMFKYIHNDHISQTWKDKDDFVFSDKLLNCYLESLYYATLEKHQDIIQFIRDNAPMPEKMEYSNQTKESMKIKLNLLSDFEILDFFN